MSYFASYNQDVLVAVRETHYHGLSWSFTFQQAPRNEPFSTFRSPGMHHYAIRSRSLFTLACAESQVDVVFPFDHELQAAFGELETDYYTSRAPLCEIYESLRVYGRESGSGLSRCVFFCGTLVFCPTDVNRRATSDAHVASTGTFLPDAWSCREGSVVLSAGKETFESLGLPGTKISTRMPGAPEQYRTSDHILRF